MNKKGFTLIEMLCVVVIISVLAVMVSTNLFNNSSNNKELYCAKVKMIEDYAREYGIKYELELDNSTELYNGYKSIKIKINDLVESGKLEPDKDSDVINPMDNSKMNDLEIILYLKNKQIFAEIPNNICEK